MLGFWADGVGISPPTHFGPNMTMPKIPPKGRDGSWLSLFTPLRLKSKHQTISEATPSKNAIFKVKGDVWVKVTGGTKQTSSAPTQLHSTKAEQDAVEWISLEDLKKLQSVDSSDKRGSTTAHKKRKSAPENGCDSSVMQHGEDRPSYYTGKWFIRSQFEFWNEAFGEL
jgi:hypothetical protein